MRKRGTEQFTGLNNDFFLQLANKKQPKETTKKPEELAAKIMSKSEIIKFK